ncbi:hypothetical protein [Anthocerotibacter panamensis]|uniref:hypothetical protein n=1 Tax=Anthocerotibacter panamensis TaxID=2857077 RepID=UPI001C405085|nr:hypothetical protein [Anthocerotibacter panamensis]
MSDLHIIDGQLWGHLHPTDAMPQPLPLVFSQGALIVSLAGFDWVTWTDLGFAPAHRIDQKEFWSKADPPLQDFSVLDPAQVLASSPQQSQAFRKLLQTVHEATAEVRYVLEKVLLAPQRPRSVQVWSRRSRRHLRRCSRRCSQ